MVVYTISMSVIFDIFIDLLIDLCSLINFKKACQSALVRDIQTPKPNNYRIFAQSKQNKTTTVFLRNQIS